VQQKGRADEKRFCKVSREWRIEIKLSHCDIRRSHSLNQ